MNLKIICICFITAVVASLKDVRIQTPVAVKKGESTRLYCWYNTEGDPLYIVKWYKAGQEFYRFIPQENPPTRSFSVGNLKIKVTAARIFYHLYIHNMKKNKMFVGPASTQ